MKTFKKLFLCLLVALPFFTSANIYAQATPPNDEIWYESESKLSETTSFSSSGLHTNAFNTMIISHTFFNGKGVIKFYGNIISIGERAFLSCSSLASISIPNSVTNIGYDAFDGCSSLTSITIPNSVTSIGVQAFWGCTSLASVTIGNLVTSIGELAFYGCTSLSSITIPNSVMSIERGAFSGCSSLASIKVENGNRVYDSRENCNAIIETSTNKLITGCKNTVIPNSVTSIGNSAFMECSSLTSITIPNSVTSIGSLAFCICSKLAEVYCYADKVPSTGISVFSDVPLSSATLYVPKKSIVSYEITSPWSEFGTITNIPEHNVFITDLSDNTSIIEVKSNDSFSLTDNIKSLEITETIPSVNLTYTRNFDSKMVNNWQAWYMPCDFDYDDLSEDFDVAEIEGALISSTGETYIAFTKMTNGTVNAHTPYVVRAKAAGDAVITTTTTLQPTADAKSFAIQTAKKNFTFGGVYENSYLSAEQPTYALAKNGNFSMMGSSVYLRPLRIYMRITDREDNPYAAVTAPQEVKVVVLGEDATSIDEIHNSEFIIHNDESSEIYNLGGQKLQKLQKGINIVNGKKVILE